MIDKETYNKLTDSEKTIVNRFLEKAKKKRRKKVWTKSSAYYYYDSSFKDYFFENNHEMIDYLVMLIDYGYYGDVSKYKLQNDMAWIYYHHIDELELTKSEKAHWTKMLKSIGLTQIQLDVLSAKLCSSLNG